MNPARTKLAVARYASRAARAVANEMRAHGTVPDAGDVVHVTDAVFRQLETHGLLQNDLHVRARWFASFLLLVEEAMMESEN